MRKCQKIRQIVKFVYVIESNRDNLTGNKTILGPKNKNSENVKKIRQIVKFVYVSESNRDNLTGNQNLPRQMENFKQKLR